MNNKMLAKLQREPRRGAKQGAKQGSQPREPSKGAKQGSQARVSLSPCFPICLPVSSFTSTRLFLFLFLFLSVLLSRPPACSLTLLYMLCGCCKMARELGSKHPKKAESEANCTIQFPVYFHYRLESFSILIKQSVHLLRMLFCCCWRAMALVQRRSEDADTRRRGARARGGAGLKQEECGASNISPRRWRCAPRPTPATQIAT